MRSIACISIAIVFAEFVRRGRASIGVICRGRGWNDAECGRFISKDLMHDQSSLKEIAKALCPSDGRELLATSKFRKYKAMTTLLLVLNAMDTRRAFSVHHSNPSVNMCVQNKSFKGQLATWAKAKWKALKHSFKERLDSINGTLEESRKKAKMKESMESSIQFEELESDLASALRAEDYKTAAKLRDSLKVLRAANPSKAMEWERNKNLKALLTTALSTEESSESREKAVKALTDMATPPMPAPGADDALHKILVETTGDIQNLAQASLTNVWLKSGDEETDKLLQYGIDLIADQYYERALEKLTAAITKSPDFAEAWSRRATTHFLRDDFELAIENCEVALELNPRNFGCLFCYGLALMRRGDMNEGWKMLRKAKRINPILY